MVSLKEIHEIVKGVLLEYRKKVQEEEILIEQEIYLAELLNPENSFEYKKEGKSIFVYQDRNENYYFVRITYQPTEDPHFELKTGWFENNDFTKPKYDPPLSPNSTSIDGNKRSNTVAKIYRDEIIPLFLNQEISDKLIFKPISDSRYQFALRLIRKFTPPELKIKEENKQIIISK